MKSFLLVLYMVLASILFAETIEVPADYGSIQDALNAADSGDVVRVSAGIYYENLVWPGKNGISLVGEDSSNTIVDGRGAGRVVTINSSFKITNSRTIIQNLVLQNGGNVRNGAGLYLNNFSLLVDHVIIRDNAIYDAPSGPYDRGGGIYSQNSDLQLQNSSIISNQAEDGGGLFVENSSLIISHSRINENFSKEFGGGFSCTGSGSVLISFSEIRNNESERGGGVFFHESQGEIISTRIIQNIAKNQDSEYADDESQGGGICCWQNTILNISSSDLADNQSRQGGAIFLEGTSSARLSGCMIARNNAEKGGAIYSRECQTEITGSTLDNNFALDGGDGIYIYGNNLSSVEQCNFTGHAHSIDLQLSDLSAENNYFESAAGPYHDTQNLSGSGDTVDSQADILPFLTAPNLSAPPISPQKFHITDQSNDFVTVSWEESAMGDFKQYVLYRSDKPIPENGNVDSVIIEIRGDTEYTYTDVVIDETYYFAGITIDRYDNRSWFSVEDSITIFDKPPFVLDSIPDYVVPEDTADLVIDLAPVFSDSDDVDSGIIKRIFSSSDSTLLSAMVKQNKLILAFFQDQNGKAEIIVNGFSNTKSVNDTFLVEVLPEPDNPVGFDTTITIDEDFVFAFSKETIPFYDADGDTLRGIRLSSVPERGFLLFKKDTVKVNFLCTELGQLSFYPEENRFGENYATISYFVMDTSGAFSDHISSLTFTVRSVDDPLHIAHSIADFTVDEDAPDTTINLGPVFFDDDDLAIDKSIVEVSDTTLVKVSISGDDLTLDFLDNKFGKAEIQIAGASADTIVIDTFTVTVYPVNDSPFSRDTSIVLAEDSLYDFVKYDFGYEDLENDKFGAIIITLLPDKGTLKYLDNVVEAGISYKYIQNLQYVPESNGTGQPYTFFKFKMMAIDKTISDSAYTCFINVMGHDDPPQIDRPLPDLTFWEDGPDTLILLQDVFSDPDDLMLNKTLEMNSNPAVVNSFISGDSLVLSFSENAFGSGEITIRAAAGEFSVADTFSVHVLPVNDRPLSKNDTITLVEDYLYKFSPEDFYFQDIEDGPFTAIQIIEFNGPGELRFNEQSPDPDSLYSIELIETLTFLPNENETGSPYSFFYFRVFDGVNVSESDYQMMIQVLEENDPPAWTSSLPDTVVSENELLDLALIAADPEQDSLIFRVDSFFVLVEKEWVFANEQDFGVVVDSDHFQWQPDFNQSGEYKIRLLVSDGELQDFSTFLVRIENVNRPPVFFTLLNDTTIHNGTVFKFQFNVADPDDDSVKIGLVETLEGISVDETGLLSWQVPDEPEEFYDLQLYATDFLDTAYTAAQIKVVNVVALDETATIPATFSLSQAYPNPFNPVTQIAYTLPQNTHVRLLVYDSRGKLVETLVDEIQVAGYYQFTWNATQFSSGIYFYKMVTTEFTDVKKCILLK
ncbi:MAG: T9SS type A sorting domain-containing protein [Candidatus Marinimicrobia bacterium]|nr:T9SS type A sorting domain-containing protein [Candidatus Neomarinimicrobiota bacterium]